MLPFIYTNQRLDIKNKPSPNRRGSLGGKMVKHSFHQQTDEEASYSWTPVHQENQAFSMKSVERLHLRSFLNNKP